jgi:hypothetical protein
VGGGYVGYVHHRYEGYVHGMYNADYVGYVYRRVCRVCLHGI